MRKSKYILLIFLTAVAAASCKKSFYSDANNNPNAPSSSSIIPGVMLSTVEGTLGYTQGGDISRFTSLITQQTKGISRQAQGYYGYTFTSVDFDSPWGNMYTSVLENNKTLIQLADAKGDNAYSGIGRILLAYALQVAVDMWGPVPYSQAFQGANQLQASYDSDKALYDTISTLITTGIGQLNDADPGVLVPGVEDVIYGGDVSKWIMFAHAIQARLYIHQSKGTAAMATNALTEIAASFTSNADNAQYIFGSTETSSNPWYQFNQQRTDISFATSPLGEMLSTAGDPRFPILIDEANDNLLYYGNINSPVEFITYDELLFMKAEATIRSGGSVAEAQTFFQDAIHANMEKLGVAAADITTYIAANGTLAGTADEALAKIGAEEYIALYLNPEAFTTWRRIGSPAITPIAGANVPRRFLYPQTEYSYNGKNVPQATLFAPRVFWDTD